MEVKPETGMVANREPFPIAMQKPNLQSPPSMQNMRLTFTPDGTAVYKPVTAAPPPPQPANLQGGGSINNSGGSQPSSGLMVNMGEKKKRGRPRKYGPDGAPVHVVGLGSPQSRATPNSGPTGTSGPSGFIPTNLGSPTGMGSGPSGVPGLSSGDGSNVIKKRGRPSGSGRKMQMAALGSAGSGFTPHIITVNTGEDVSAKIMSFSQNGSRAICILSANGAISNVTLRQAATSGGTVTYEGRFEILSLSGSFLLTESGGHRSRTGGLSISLANPDGRVLGGGVAGLLTAASPVQVVVGSFIPEGKKELKHISFQQPFTAPNPTNSGPIPMAAAAHSPISQGTSSESDDEPEPIKRMNQNSGFVSSNTNNNNHPGIVNMQWK